MGFRDVYISGLHPACFFVKALTKMAGFWLVDVAARTIHSGIRNLWLQMARAVFVQSDIGQAEWLLTEILVSHSSIHYAIQ